MKMSLDVTSENIKDIIGNYPNNLKIYQEAFAHKSCSKKSFERLEFIGDAVLGLIVAKIIYNKYPNKDEGFMTKLRTKVVRSSTCCYLSKKMSLDKFIKSKMINDRIIADIFESFIGALYLDLGFDIVDKYIEDLINTNINFEELLSSNDNYKDIIMRYTQHNNLPLPIYELVETYGPPHSRTFKVTMYIIHNGTKCLYGTGISNTKKDAEQMSCKDAICFLNRDNCGQEHLKLHVNELEF